MREQVSLVGHGGNICGDQGQVGSRKTHRDPTDGIVMSRVS